MATFVHISAAKFAARIRRSGINPSLMHTGKVSGVFAMPVTPNFFYTHQWIRELKRRGQRQMIAIYFRIPDDTIVWVGRFNQTRDQMTATEAVALLLKAEQAKDYKSSQGYEIFIPRKIAASEITRVQPLKAIGWRFFPGSHGRVPCACPACLERGEIKAQRIRRKYGSE